MSCLAYIEIKRFHHTPELLKCIMLLASCLPLTEIIVNDDNNNIIQTDDNELTEINHYPLLKLLNQESIILVIGSFIIACDEFNTPDNIGWKAIYLFSYHIPSLLTLHCSSTDELIVDRIIMLSTEELGNILDISNTLWNYENINLCKHRIKIDTIIYLLVNFRKNNNLKNINSKTISILFQFYQRLDQGFIHLSNWEDGIFDLDKLYKKKLKNNNNIDSFLLWSDRILISIYELLIDMIKTIPQVCQTITTLNECINLWNCVNCKSQLLCMYIINSLLVFEQDEIKLLNMEKENNIKLSKLNENNNGKKLDDNNKVKSIKKSESNGMKNLKNNKNKNDKNNIATTTNISNKDRSDNIRSGNIRNFKNLKSKTLDEICRSGFLRSLVWSFLHIKYEIRMQTLEIIDNIISMLKSDNNSEIWTSLIEQGVVPLLEIISNGLYMLKIEVNENNEDDNNKEIINNCKFSDGFRYNSNRFPELNIRKKCNLLLVYLISKLQSTSSIKSRLMGALIHTGSVKLRGSIFAGLIFVSTRSNSLGRFLCGPMSTSSNINNNKLNSSSNNSNEIFIKLFELLYKDHSDLNNIISTINHVINISIKIQEFRKNLKLNINNYSKNNIEAEIKINNKDIIDVDDDDNNNNSNDDDNIKDKNDTINELIKDGPIVLVNNEGQMVKMVCPAPSIILKHSKKLSELFETLVQNQLISAQSILKKDKNNTNDDTIIKRVISNLTNNYFISLEGTYCVWQDVFSHMVDDYLLQSSLSRMSFNDLMEAFNISLK
jgi:hypothetical protein